MSLNSSGGKNLKYLTSCDISDTIIVCHYSEVNHPVNVFNAETSELKGTVWSLSTSQVQFSVHNTVLQPFLNRGG